MPRITININAPDDQTDQDIITLDIPPGLTVADLKGFVEAETKFPSNSQQFFLNGQTLSNDSQTLEDAGIKDGEMIAMLVNRPAASSSSGAPRSQQPRQQAGRQGRRRGAPSNDEIETTRLHILGDPRSLSALIEQKPELANVVNDPVRFREAWMALYMEDEARERERQQQIALLNEDPFNEEAQKKIEEMIRQERVIENLQHAYENNPEVFARVTMLYIPVEVNGHPIKAFVDSGAQATIMSPEAATRCGIMRLIDTRYSGIAKGVGTARILGRVHSAEIKIGDAVVPCAFTVMEGKDVDLLLGLDMLKRYQASIDLKRGVLRLGEGNEVEFLPEKDIPKEVENAQQDEPVVPGPGGTEIGTKTGAVKPAGTSAAAGESSGHGAAQGNFQGQGQVLGNNPSAASTVPQAQQGAAQQPQQPAGGSTTHPEEAISQLVALGFDRRMAISALDATRGNVDMAASFLFN